MTARVRKSDWRRPCTLVYLVMLGLTAATYAVGTAGLGGLQLSLLVLGFALLKAHLVGDWFMGLRGLSGSWRWVVAIWVLIPGILITAAFVAADGG